LVQKNTVRERSQGGLKRRQQGRSYRLLYFGVQLDRLNYMKKI